jgi:hypothetical protein
VIHIESDENRKSKRAQEKVRKNTIEHQGIDEQEGSHIRAKERDRWFVPSSIPTAKSEVIHIESDENRESKRAREKVRKNAIEHQRIDEQ